MQTLSHDQVKSYYDWFGAWQDSQRFYEDAAVSDLLAHGDFTNARSVFEFGCGTGRFAESLLADRVPSSCRYRAVDISATMVRLARTRLAPWGDRAHVSQSSGAMRVSAADQSFDHFIACYVFDLLSAEDMRRLLAEAHRVLAPNGLLCVVGLTHGTSPVARAVGWLWQSIFRIHPKLVGGCRPISLRDYLDSRRWVVRYRNVVTRFAISSEVLVASSVK